MSPAFMLACGPTYLKIRFLVCLSWKDMQKGLRWGAKLSGVGKYEAASDVQRFLMALRGPSAPTTLLPYYQFPCPLQTNAGYSKPQPNCVTATLRKSFVKIYYCTSEQVFPYCCLFVCESIIFSQDYSLYMLHFFFFLIYLCFFLVFLAAIL